MLQALVMLNRYNTYLVDLFASTQLCLWLKMRSLLSQTEQEKTKWQWWQTYKDKHKKQHKSMENKILLF